ncbi:hypothetical protein [Francisella adeliensis]|nr:hypothetical protein [Francisella adeliensis]MBK2085666.1 hypothetical protein [Francisella adeliensis]MBK2097544.1 hypothetical protein [Francisella adeliensis]QIW12002.1 hypothetical protein FZC43_04780 [Francisella adeliensis]QIW13877.1 hypothetical protein FZC44_04780 [Francisella adeliensis]
MIVTLYVRYPANYSYQIDLTCQILFGIGCGGGMLAFQEIQVEFKKPHLRSLANSMVLTVSYLFAGIILQPIIGMIIGTTSFKLPRNTVITSHNLLDQPVVQHAWHHYNIGLLLLVVILGFSFISSLFFTKKITN